MNKYTVTAAQLVRLGELRGAQVDRYAVAHIKEHGCKPSTAAPDSRSYDPRADRKAGRVALVNGSVHDLALPLGKLCAWARTFKPDTRFEVRLHEEPNREAVELHHGFSFLRLYGGREVLPNSPRGTARDWLGEPLQLVADLSGEYRVIEPAPDGVDAKGALRSAAQEAKLAKARQKLREANATMRHAVKRHFTDAALGADTETALIWAWTERAALRDLREAIRSPHTLPDWCPETYKGTLIDGEWHPSNCREAHADLCAAWVDACKTFHAFKPRNRKSYSWSQPVPVYGPKWIALKRAMTDARKRVESFLEQRWREVWAERFPGIDTPTYLYLRQSHQTSRARLRVRRWPAQKREHAQRIIEARATLGELQRKGGK